MHTDNKEIVELISSINDHNGNDVIIAKALTLTLKIIRKLELEIMSLKGIDISEFED